MARECYPIAYRGIHSEEQNLFMMRNMYSDESLTAQMTGGSEFLIVENDDEACGYCAYKPSEGNEHGEGKVYCKGPVIYLDKLYILPQCKGKGYGRILVDKVLEAAKALHPTGCTIRLDCNRLNSAKAFYEHLGFEVKSAWDAPIGNGYFMNAYTMEMEI